MKFLSLFKDIKKIANYQRKSLMSAELNGCFDIKKLCTSVGCRTRMTFNGLNE